MKKSGDQTSRILRFLADRLEKILHQPRTFATRYLYSLGIILAINALILFFSQPKTNLIISAVSFLSIPLVCLIGGLGLGLVTATTTSLSIDYSFLQPTNNVLLHGTDFLFYGVNLTSAVLASALISALRVAYETVERAYHAADEASRGREETLAVVSHDLKNPLANLSLNCNIILPLLAEGDPKLIARRVNSMQRSIVQMDRLIQDLLDASMLDSRTFSTTPADTELVPLLHQISESHRESAERKDVHLEFRSKVSTLVLQTDGKRLDQALSNVIGNAIKFSPRGGQVMLTLDHDEESVRISVSDEGVGIPAEHHERIFSRNWQAKDTAYLGSGLGLYIAKGIMDNLGGRIILHSEIGKGSTFHFVFPSSRRTIRSYAKNNEFPRPQG